MSSNPAVGRRATVALAGLIAVASAVRGRVGKFAELRR
jgi:hypothetical protein